jgi:phage terminase small subunit
LNGKQAAIRAGYSARSAEVAASTLLRIPKISEAVQIAQAKQLESAELQTTRVLEELRRVALSNVKGLPAPRITGT